MRRRACAVCGLTALAAALLTISSTPVQADDPPAGVKIGMIDSLFQDMPVSTVMVMMKPFAAIMEAQTGVSGELVPSGDALALGRDLSENKVQLGIFHGIEFAWARQKYPELKPLMIAINQQPYLNAYLIARDDSQVTHFQDLGDSAVALPRHSLQHCHFFLRRRCREQRREARLLIAKNNSPPTVEDALDDVVDGAIKATVVDGVSLDCFKRRKPGRFARLKIIEISEVFPAAVVAYRPGILDEPTLGKFRDGMLGANQSAVGKQMLTLWKLTGFTTVPEDYEQNLSDIARAYPMPIVMGK
jgi:ABC-type phosphate/phosphonate transport system substrate-binding protein